MEDYDGLPSARHRGSVLPPAATAETAPLHKEGKRLVLQMETDSTGHES